MKNRALVFDANSVLLLVRELRGKASDILVEQSTVSLAYYEAGNALWKECFLAKRMSREEAFRLLEAIFAVLRTMDVAPLGDDGTGKTILDLAGTLGITFYDAAYLSEAKRSKKVLVTDDDKLSEAARNLGVKTTNSRSLCQRG